MVKNVNKISKEFIVDVEGIVSVPEKPIESTSHKVRMIFFVCFSATHSSRLAGLVFAVGDPSKEGVLHQQGSGSTASQPGRYSPE
jgi:hypothetical protein